MWNVHIFLLLLLRMVDKKTSALSFNQPNFSSTALWNPNAITFANSSIVGRKPSGIFINTDNTIYVIDRQNKQIIVWNEGSIDPVRKIDVDFIDSWSLFVTSNGDIYIDDGGARNRQVLRWMSNTSTFDTVMNVKAACYGLFVDINENLYCSVFDHDQVMKQSLRDSNMTSTVVAGTGNQGSASDELHGPKGIFVDVNLDLYVTDCLNNRVQLLQSGSTHGITVAGERSSTETIGLVCPSGIVLDAQKYLFIVEDRNHRVVGSGPNGFRCLVGCYGEGSQFSQLCHPFALSFDRFGNMFVTDQSNHRIQKFELIQSTLVVSFNQPKFCPTAIWNPNAITFANSSIVGELSSTGIFINTDNTIYVPHRQNKQIIVWNEGSIDPVRKINVNFTDSFSLFVISNGDIYIDDGKENGRVLRWIPNTEIVDTVMNVESQCDGLFVDIHENLYCSMHWRHQVMKQSLRDSNMTSTVVAGTGNQGSASNELYEPRGIFVDVNLDLYVTDYLNNRVQLFQSGSTHGITVAGETSSTKTISLGWPSGIVLDAQKYLFIVDCGDRRVVGSGPNGFRCLVGCNSQGSESSQLNGPFTLSFDRFGNMFVTDQSNSRIQKFEYLEHFCVRPFNQLKFCPTSVWNRNGISFANRTTTGSNPSTVFINRNNSIYTINRDKKQILVWHGNTINPTKVISSNFTNSASLFALSNGDIYIDDGETTGRVKKWVSRTNKFITVMNVFSSCYGLFIDSNDTLYCSMPNRHLVAKTPLRGALTTITVAGTGDRGFGMTELDHPHGIFVDTDFDLYVADCENDRVQLFQSGSTHIITVAGRGSSHSASSLSCPTGIVLDVADGLFIADSKNHRIMRLEHTGIRCVLGCYGSAFESTQLFSPSSLSFDSFGNMFVVDTGNNRIEKFQYSQTSCDDPSSVFLEHEFMLTTSSQMYSRDCERGNFYYEAFEINVPEIRYFTIWTQSEINTYGFIYEKSFNSLNPTKNLLASIDDGNGFGDQFKFDLPLFVDTTYILVVTTFRPNDIGKIKIYISRLTNFTINPLTTSVNTQFNHSFQLTDTSPMYYRDCQIPKCYYETFQIEVNVNGSYVIWSMSQIDTYGYIYRDNFDPLKPSENLLFQHNGSCNQGQFKFIIDLQINTRYLLVATTYHPYTIGGVSIFISGLHNVSVNQFNPKHSYCIIGDQCNFYSKSIGLTLDDILHEELQTNRTLHQQSFWIKISASLTIIMFIGGLINSVLSFLTFKSEEAQQVGCGLYLLASSITSFITISMFVVKFWFVVGTEINVSTSLTVLKSGCISIEPLLKIFLYLDGWLNACVAVERAMHVFKGVSFHKKKSKLAARWIILILPVFIAATLVHEPVNRDLFEYKVSINETERYERYTNTTDEGTRGRNVWCVARYSSSVQDYNTAILFFHLVGPFIANLFSALFIIFGAARRRSVARTDQTFQEHVREQFSEHKQLIISPIVLLILSIPRLIIALLPGCVKTSEQLWLYLSAYFISFTPSILVFVIFVSPSDLYMKIFRTSFSSWLRQTRQ